MQQGMDSSGIKCTDKEGVELKVGDWVTCITRVFCVFGLNQKDNLEIKSMINGNPITIRQSDQRKIIIPISLLRIGFLKNPILSPDP